VKQTKAPAREPEVTPDLARAHGLTDEEWQAACRIAGRTPTYTELGVFSVMWSEHCSYKSSRRHLLGFPTTGQRVLQGPGENAGIVDIGDGWAVAFKMESHNHPSFVEPVQGAATGVGGILRDVFTMGARPIASLNSLRFGLVEAPRMRYLLGGVVAGIGGYGNSFGCPTVGGEISFHPCYNGNILVNAFNLGLIRSDRIFRGSADGVGNPVIYLGSRTGRDGIHGASLLASAGFDETSEQKRPTVQVGDPFAEKCLLEACLELMATDWIIGIQDMGAAGLTSSSFEMASRAGNGVRLDLDRVPRREEGMTPYELMLSESQERMLMVVRRGCEEKAKTIFTKWDLQAEVVGEVTDTGRVVATFEGKVVVDLPARPLAEEAPAYDRPSAVPPGQADLRTLDLAAVPVPEDLGAILRRLLASPNLCSKEWAFQQYDQTVRGNTVVGPGSDAAVVRIKETSRAIALTADCNSRWCLLDPYEGARAAIAEAARNLACSGARPIGVTDCLNFGNPERPGIMWQFKECVRGLADACREVGVPIVSGNVSFYNETEGNGIHPTPTVAMVGLIDDARRHAASSFCSAGDAIVLLGVAREELGGTEYLAVVHDLERGVPPAVDLPAEANLRELLVAGIEAGLFRSAHDCSDGGFAVALAECCISGERPVGATVDLDPTGGAGETALRLDALLFGETNARAIVSCGAAEAATALDLAATHGVPARIAGTVGGDRLRIRAGGRACVDEEITHLAGLWRNALPLIMGGMAGPAGI